MEGEETDETDLVHAACWNICDANREGGSVVEWSEENEKGVRMVNEINDGIVDILF